MRPRRFDISRSPRVIATLMYTAPLLLGVGLIYVIHHDYLASEQANRSAYHSASDADLIMTADGVESTIETVYQNLRTIARLTGVRQLDPAQSTGLRFRGGHGLEENTRLAAQEIYNNLASSVAVSELYIVPVNFDPDALEDSDKAVRQPLATFDQLILNQTQEGPADEHQGVKEIEIHEYRLMRRQLAWLKKNYPSETYVPDLNNYPLITGPEVITCDNTRYSPSNPNDEDRSGIVLSVPFFGPDGKLRGCISGVILSKALADLLPGSTYAIVNPKHQYHVSKCDVGRCWASHEHAEKAQPDPGVIYSQVRTLSTHDQGGQWSIWVALPDEMYWSRSDVRAAVRARDIGYGFVVIMILTAIPCAWLILRGQREVRLANLDLEKTVAKKTDELLQLLNTFDQQKFAVDQHAILITTNVQGYITQFNSKLCETSGYEPEELANQHWKVLHGGDIPEELNHQMWGLLAQGKIWRGEIKQRAKDGSHYWVYAATVPIKDDNGCIIKYISIQTDISEYKGMHNRLLRDAEKARASA